MNGAEQTGYNFREKDLYRRHAWNAVFADMWKPRSEAVCMIMPSLEGHEIEYLKRNGIKERNICMVDKNPAVVASLKRRMFPHATSYGISIDRAIVRASLKESKALDCIHMDFCGPITYERISSIHTALHLALSMKKEPFYLILNFLRGRDLWIANLYRKFVTANKYMSGYRDSSFWNYSPTPLDVLRMACLSSFIATGVVRREAGKDQTCLFPVLLRSGTYLSEKSGQSFLWTVFRVNSHTCILQYFEELNAILDITPIGNTPRYRIVERRMNEALDSTTTGPWADFDNMLTDFRADPGNGGENEKHAERKLSLAMRGVIDESISNKVDSDHE